MVATYVPGPHGPMVFSAAVVSGYTLNFKGTQAFQTNSSSFNYTMTVNAGTHTVLEVVLIRAHGTNDTSAGVALTWDSGGTNQAMTLLKSVLNGGLNVAQVWGLRNPTTGTNLTLHVAATNVGADNFVCGVAFDHIATTVDDATAFPHTSGDAAGGATKTVTSAVGNVVVYAVNNSGAAATPLGTTLISDNVNGSIINAAAGYMDGASPTVAAGMNSGSSTALAVVDAATG